LIVSAKFFGDLQLASAGVVGYDRSSYLERGRPEAKPNRKSSLFRRRRRRSQQEVFLEEQEKEKSKGHNNICNRHGDHPTEAIQDVADPSNRCIH